MDGTGFATVGNGLNTPAAVIAGGLRALSSTTVNPGNFIASPGSLSVTSTIATGNALSMADSSAALAGNLLLGQVSAGSTGANILTLLEGNTVLLQVSICLFMPYCNVGLALVSLFD